MTTQPATPETIQAAMLKALTEGTDFATALAQIKDLTTTYEQEEAERKNKEAKAQTQARVAYGNEVIRLIQDALDGEGLTFSASMEVGEAPIVRVALDTIAQARLAQMIGALEAPSSVERLRVHLMEDGNYGVTFGGQRRTAGTSTDGKGTDGNGTGRGHGWILHGEKVTLRTAFDAVATPEEQQALDAAGKDSNKVYNVQLRAVKRANLQPA